MFDFPVFAALPRASHISAFSFWGKLMGLGVQRGDGARHLELLLRFLQPGFGFQVPGVNSLGGGCHSEVFQEVEHRRTTHRFPSSPRYVEATGRSIGSEQLWMGEGRPPWPHSGGGHGQGTLFRQESPGSSAALLTAGRVLLIRVRDLNCQEERDISAFPDSGTAELLFSMYQSSLAWTCRWLQACLSGGKCSAAAPPVWDCYCGTSSGARPCCSQGQRVRESGGGLLSAPRNMAMGGRWWFHGCQF